jgi:enamine deaminase RidA (YjgF/YER057c/UK114 family)
MRRFISSGSTFEREIGYSRAVVDGEWVFVSGTTGFDYKTMTISNAVVEQAEQCLLNIEAALAEQVVALRTLSASATSCRGRRISNHAGQSCGLVFAMCIPPLP